MEKTVFFYDEQKLKCPVTAALEVMGGKWKPIILVVLSEGPHRFGEIKRRIPKISQKILTQMLRELEQDKLISRKIYNVIPPKVEYTLTELGNCLEPIIDQVYQWGIKYTVLNTPAAKVTSGERELPN